MSEFLCSAIWDTELFNNTVLITATETTKILATLGKWKTGRFNQKWNPKNELNTRSQPRKWTPRRQYLFYLYSYSAIILLQITTFCVQPHILISTETDREHHQTPGSCVHARSTLHTDFSWSFHCKVRQR